MPMRQVAYLVLVIMVGCAGAEPVSAQAGPPDNLTELQKENTALRSVLDKMEAELKIFYSARQSGQEKINKVYNNSVVDFYRYSNDLRDHADSILSWQLISAYIVLVMVVLVTGLGIFLSFIEVRAALRIPEKVLAIASDAKPNPDTVSEGEPDETYAGKTEDGRGASKGTTLIISPDKLQITSAVTGVVILVISLGFLYLFVSSVLTVKPGDFTSAYQPTGSTPNVADGKASDGTQ